VKEFGTKVTEVAMLTPEILIEEMELEIILAGWLMKEEINLWVVS